MTPQSATTSLDWGRAKRAVDGGEVALSRTRSQRAAVAVIPIGSFV